MGRLGTGWLDEHFPLLLQIRENLGTVLVSLCYTPESKKLSVIVLRAKDLNKGNTQDTGLWEKEGEGGRRREKEGGGGRRREKEGEGGRRREEEGGGGRRREKEGGGGRRREKEGGGGRRREKEGEGGKRE